MVADSTVLSRAGREERPGAGAPPFAALAGESRPSARWNVAPRLFSNGGTAWEIAMNDEESKRLRDSQTPADYDEYGDEPAQKEKGQARAGDSRLKRDMNGQGSIDNDPGNEDPGSLVEELSRSSTANGQEAPRQKQVEPPYDLPNASIRRPRG
jgi:hypothetical protein